MLQHLELKELAVCLSAVFEEGRAVASLFSEQAVLATHHGACAPAGKEMRSVSAAAEKALNHGMTSQGTTFKHFLFARQTDVGLPLLEKPEHKLRQLMLQPVPARSEGLECMPHSTPNVMLPAR